MEEGVESHYFVDINLPPNSVAIYRPKALVEAIKKIIKVEEISGLAVQKNVYEWNVSVRTLQAKDALIKQRKIILSDGSVGIAKHPFVKEVKIRMHWLPLYVEVDELQRALKKYGKIVESSREKYSDPELKNLYNGTWNLTLQLESDITADDIPSYLDYEYGQTLLEILGREVKCSKCKSGGHLPMECPKRKKKSKNKDGIESQVKGREVEVSAENGDCEISSSDSELSIFTDFEKEIFSDYGTME